METHIIQRAFQLAPMCHDIEELRGRLVKEGYANIDSHLAGPSLRKELTKLFK